MQSIILVLIGILIRTMSTAIAKIIINIIMNWMQTILILTELVFLGISHILQLSLLRPSRPRIYSRLVLQLVVSNYRIGSEVESAAGLSLGCLGLGILFE